MRKLLWTVMLRTDMNVRYWDEMIRRYVRKERRLQLALAVASSGTAATLFLAWGPGITKAVSTGTACLSIYLAWLSSTKPVDRMSAIKKAHMTALMSYEELWGRIEANPQDATNEDRFKELQESQIASTSEEPHFPLDEELLRACQAAVLRSRGI